MVRFFASRKNVYGNFYDYDRCFEMIHAFRIIFYLFFTASNLPRMHEFPPLWISGKFSFFAKMCNKSSVCSDPIQHYKFSIIYRSISPTHSTPSSLSGGGFSLALWSVFLFRIFMNLLLIFISLFQQCIIPQPATRMRLMMEL